jgi:hypothetical protein
MIALAPMSVCYASNVNVTNNALPQNETTVASDPNNPLNLIVGTNDWRYATPGSRSGGDAGVYWSFNGGTTWQGDTFKSLYPDSAVLHDSGDPAVAALRDGTFYFTYYDIGGVRRLPVVKTTDGGANWVMPPGIVVEYGLFTEQPDKPYIAVDNTGTATDGVIHVVYTRIPYQLTPCTKNRIMASYSTDGGLTYVPPYTIDDSCSAFPSGAVPAVGPLGERYVAWLQWGIDEDNAYIWVERYWGDSEPVNKFETVLS